MYNSIDPSGSVKTLTEAQSAVHAGGAYSFSGNQIGLLNGASVKFLSTVGANQVHFNGFSVSTSQAPVRVEFYEGTTTSALGTALSPVARNRGDIRVPTMGIYMGPTVTANGTKLDETLLVEISQGANKVSGTGGVSPGWVLEAGTTYMIVVTNLSGVTINWNASFEWHEAEYTL